MATSKWLPNTRVVSLNTLLGPPFRFRRSNRIPDVITWESARGTRGIAMGFTCVVFDGSAPTCSFPLIRYSDSSHGWILEREA